MGLHIVVHPRFGDTARVATDLTGRPWLVADIDTGGTFSVQVNDELGGIELAAQMSARSSLRRRQPVMAGPATGREAIRMNQLGVIG
ncbi:MAG: hypothetical protein ACRDRS_17505 [Pseudonocardiaceae bacterium]